MMYALLFSEYMTDRFAFIGDRILIDRTGSMKEPPTRQSKPPRRSAIIRALAAGNLGPVLSHPQRPPHDGFAL